MLHPSVYKAMVESIDAEAAPPIPNPIPVAKCPGFLESLNPSHAEIPDLPEDLESFDLHWNYGWPVSMKDVRALIETHSPNDLQFFEPGPVVLLAAVDAHATKVSGCQGVRHVLVEPTEAANWPTGVVTEKGGPSVSFFVVVSTTNDTMFQSRPSKEHMEKLTKFFGKEPCWMKD
ncbi:hypothetical protein BD626DRAFT_507567 [Schizophyllum amplum]|uniref:Uncharacterized protein n=1 Tax=Schizophyllum amplum TaxID=97359 RepID=A0A550C436_9AGAR|nr:hypothetical protein BD626DRAFT_507567 [Auriculariopsis ampla]